MLSEQSLKALSSTGISCCLLKDPCGCLLVPDQYMPYQLKLMLLTPFDPAIRDRPCELALIWLNLFPLEKVLGSRAVQFLFAQKLGYAGSRGPYGLANRYTDSESGLK